jgi:hypothetical protein
MDRDGPPSPDRRLELPLEARDLLPAADLAAPQDPRGGALLLDAERGPRVRDRMTTISPML